MGGMEGVAGRECLTLVESDVKGLRPPLMPALLIQ